jgi:hypothetical protein
MEGKKSTVKNRFDFERAEKVKGSKMNRKIFVCICVVVLLGKQSKGGEMHAHFRRLSFVYSQIGICRFSILSFLCTE